MKTALEDYFQAKEKVISFDLYWLHSWEEHFPESSVASLNRNSYQNRGRMTPNVRRRATKDVLACGDSHRKKLQSVPLCHRVVATIEHAMQAAWRKRAACSWGARTQKDKAERRKAWSLNCVIVSALCYFRGTQVPNLSTSSAAIIDFSVTKKVRCATGALPRSRFGVVTGTGMFFKRFWSRRVSRLYLLPHSFSV